jgi:hypothetical protein
MLLAAFTASGCIDHQARVEPPAPGEPGRPPTQVISGTSLAIDPTTVHLVHGSLPIDLPVSAWRRESDGTLLRCEARVTTPLPWWQRFPADAVSDLLPTTYAATASTPVVLAPLPPFDEVRFLAQARSDGYAAPAKPSP